MGELWPVLIEGRACHSGACEGNLDFGRQPIPAQCRGALGGGGVRGLLVQVSGQRTLVMGYLSNGSRALGQAHWRPQLT